MKNFLLSIVFLLISSHANSDAPGVVATTEGDVDSYISNTVNAITGNVTFSDEDLVVHGIEPIIIRRYYVSGEGGGYLGGWQLFPHTQMRCLIVYGDAAFFYASEPSGTSVTYSYLTKHCDKNVMHFLVGKHGVGYSNSSAGVLTGKTNLKNNYLRFDHKKITSNKKDVFIHAADGTERCYRYHCYNQAEQHIRYVLSYERKSNGNYVYYDHDENGRLVRITTKNPARTKEYAWISLSYLGKEKDDRSFYIETSDGRRLDYHCGKIGKEHYLESVKGSTSSKFFRYHGEYKDCLPKLEYASLGDDNYFGFRYYYPKDNWLPLFNKNYHVEHSNSSHVAKVKEILSPNGRGEYVTTKLFTYILGKWKGDRKGYDSNGKVTVTDQDFSQDEFYFSPELRLNSVTRSAVNAVRYCTINYEWGDQNTSFFGHLVKKAVFAESEKYVNIKNFAYDDRGNVIKEWLDGELTGKRSVQINRIPSTDIYKCQDPEVLEKHFAYSHENLITEESYSNGKRIIWGYLHGTNLVASKLTFDHNKIIRREFFFYNDDCILVKEISDDGCSPDRNDLNGVTQQLIKNIIPKNEHPALGLPEIIEEKYLDLATKEETLLKKIVLHYSKEAWVIQRDLYDAKGELAYSLKSRYDDRGNVTQETDPIGGSLEYEYDRHNNRVSITIPGLSTTYLAYNFCHQNVASKVTTYDGLNYHARNSYNNKNQKTKNVDRYGNEIFYEYDHYGNINKTIFPEVYFKGKVTRPVEEKTYHFNGEVSSHKNFNGEVTQTKYSSHNKPLSITYPDGSEEKFYYNIDGTLSEHIDVFGVKTAYYYDVLERPLIIERYAPNGDLIDEEEFIYKGVHLISHRDKEGYITEYKYDGAGRRAEEIRENRKTLFSYDSFGRLHCKEAGGICEIFEYNFLDQIICKSLEDNSGNLLEKTTHSYDSLGNLTEIIKNTTQGVAIDAMRFDSLKRVIEGVDASGNITKISYNDSYLNSLDQLCLQKSTCDSKGGITIETFDALGRLVQVDRKTPCKQLFSREEFSYDLLGNLTAQTSLILTIEAIPQELSKITVFREYDFGNQLVALKEPGKITRFSYSKRSLIDSLIRPDGQVINYEYDCLGRLIGVTGNNLDYAYQYDGLNNIVVLEDRILNQSIYRTYNAFGQVIKETFPSYSIESQYDEYGRKTELILPDQSSIRYQYDHVLRAIVRFDSRGFRKYTHLYLSYDLFCQPDEEILIGDLATKITTRDAHGRICKIESRQSFEEIEERDSLGNILKIRNSDGLSQYSYDDFSQVSSEASRYFKYDYQYDSHFNRRVKDGKKCEINDLHQVLSQDEDIYRYDENGNRIEKASLNTKTIYNYDALNRLKGIQQGSNYSEFIYDGFDRLIEKTTYQYVDEWKKASKEFYIYDSQNEIGSLDEFGKIKELRVIGHSYGAEIGGTIAIEIKGEIYAPLHDFRGNINALISLRTKQIEEKYRYSTFGQEKIFDPSGKQIKHSINPWRYSSKRTFETGLVFFGKRFYDPKAGIWINCDPQGFLDGPNPYVYLLNNPLIYIDLYGCNVDQVRESSWFTPLHTAGISLSNFYAATIDFLVHHLIPLPAFAKHFVRDLLIGPAHLLMTYQKIRDQPSSQVGSVGEKQHPRVIFLLINGMDTSFDMAHKRAQDLSAKYNGAKVYFIYNSSRGLMLDVMESICQIMGIYTHSANVAKEFIERMSEGNDMTIEAETHSQGSLVFDNATKNLDPDIKERINVTAYGPAKIIADPLLGKINNVISSRDIIPLIADPINYVKALAGILPNVDFIKGHGPWGTDHAYEGKTYSLIRRKYNEQINGKYNLK